MTDGTREVAGGRVLVVDDTIFNRRLLVRLLTSIGHETLEATDGRVALDLLREPSTPPVDVVLLDIVMPEMDGYETLEALKADPVLRDLPVIVISGVDELESVVRCIQMGAADYLPKTVAPEILRARIESSMAQKRLRDLERETLEQQRRLVATIDRQRSELSRFLSPQVAALVSSDDGEAMLAGHRREITVMFCDLRNFTGFSETAEPEEVLGFLRSYHGVMGPLIVDHEGTLEHFAGDGFMTFFNDPVLQPDHAVRAVGLAVAMRDRFADLSADWRKRGHVLEIGIGIATGYATLGRIGFEGRYDYGAVGHGVILAARLSGEAAPGEILIGSRTFAGSRGLHRRDARRRSTVEGIQPARSGVRRGRDAAGRTRDVTTDGLDPEAFRHLLDITGGDLAFVDELIDTYIDDATVQLEAMRGAAAAGDAEAMVRPAHSLKSSSANVGATAVAEASRTLEADGRSGSIDDAVARVAACEAAFEAAKAGLLAERTTR